MDWKTLLEDYGIEYITGGHYHCTSSFKWQVHCPLHSGTPDYDLGLNENSNNCWVHGKHTLEELVIAFTGCSSASTEEVIRRYRRWSKSRLERKPGRLVPVQAKLILPKTKELHKKHVNYLNNRGFDAAAIKYKHKVETTLPFGDYGDRIFIPVFHNGKIVTFTTRSMNTDPKYKNASDHESLIPIKHTLYGIDNCYHSHVILVEGVTDVWNIGDNSIALYGKAITPSQLVFILKRFKNIFVCLDPDAHESCERIVHTIKPYRSCYKILIRDKDPGEFDKNEVTLLWNHVNKQLEEEI